MILVSRSPFRLSPDFLRQPFNPITVRPPQTVLLKLSDSVKLDKFINKICLPLRNHNAYLMDDSIRGNFIQDRQYSLQP